LPVVTAEPLCATDTPGTITHLAYVIIGSAQFAVVHDTTIIKT